MGKKTVASDDVEQLRQEILKALDDAERNAYALGALWNRLVDTSLAHRQRQSPRAWWAANIPGTVTAMTVSRYGRVAKQYPVEVAAKYHMTLLVLYLAYCRAAGAAPAADPATAVISVGGKDKPFPQCSKEDLQAALQKKKPGGASAPKLDPLHARFVEIATGKLVHLLGADTETQFLAVKEGEYVTYSLLHAPDDSFPEVIDAIKEAIQAFQGETGG